MSADRDIGDAVLVTGGAVAGLCIAIALRLAGFAVVVLDASGRTATTATLKNEGWLHRATYHSVSQVTDEAALTVAERCKQGARMLAAEHPAAFESQAARSVALIHESAALDPVLARWDLCGVDHRELSRQQAAAALPEMDLDGTAAFFSVADAPIHTGRLIASLRRRLRDLGGEIVEGEALRLLDGAGTGVDVRFGDGQTGVVRSRMTVWAAGYSGSSAVAPLLHPTGIFPRYFTSHLLICDPLTARSWFEVHQGGLGLMQHGTHSVVGLNEDVIEGRPLTGSPTVDESQRAVFGAGLDRLMRRAVDLRHAGLVACTKIDLSPLGQAPRDLNLRALFVRPDVLLAYPGKMTEAPVLGCEVAAQVTQALGSTEIAVRLGDAWEDGEVILEPNPEKATVSRQGDLVLKTHRSSRRADLEVGMHTDLADLPIGLAPLHSVTPTLDGRFAVAYHWIDGEPLGPSNATDEHLDRAVTGLALFHRRYRFGTSALSLYRDAMVDNFIVGDDGRLYDIDLSSSAQVRHMLDDLALLMLTSPFPQDEVRVLYLDRLVDPGFAVATSPLLTRMSSFASNRGFGAALDAGIRNTAAAVAGTKPTATWDPQDALRALPKLSMVELRPTDDLDWFLGFRRARLEGCAVPAGFLDLTTEADR